MKELTSIEAIKDKVINSNGTLICHWTVKTGIFGGIDDNADHYIEMLKEQFDEATYIPELESEEDYILMTFKDFKKKLKKEGVRVKCKLKKHSETSREKLLRMCVITSKYANESSIIFKCYYKGSIFG